MSMVFEYNLPVGMLDHLGAREPQEAGLVRVRVLSLLRRAVQLAAVRHLMPDVTQTSHKRHTNVTQTSHKPHTCRCLPPDARRHTNVTQT
eukprot:1188947-Prorocentrum_minimum.AAC.4